MFYIYNIILVKINKVLIKKILKSLIDLIKLV